MIIHTIKGSCHYVHVEEHNNFSYKSIYNPSDSSTPDLNILWLQNGKQPNCAELSNNELSVLKFVDCDNEGLLQRLLCYTSTISYFL